MKFSDMRYSRPDTAEVIRKIECVTEKLKSASGFAETDAAFEQYDTIERDFDTMATLSHLRHTIDTRDEFYNAEVEFFDETSPEIEQYTQLWTDALLKSKFRPQLEEKYGRLIFINAEMELKTFSPGIIPELQRENALTTEYSKLIASAQIRFEGGVYTVSQMAPFKIDPDDSRRLAAWKAEAGFYAENGDKLDSLYGELTQLRTDMAKKLGYESFIELGYYRMTRNCYTQKDVEVFREAVVKHLVPLADRVYRKQAERLGKEYPMNFADNALEFRSGNARPQGSAGDILEHGRSFYHELSSDTSEFIDFMFNNELMDVLSRTGKAGGGYCTLIPNYKSPFIFANFNGTSGDVEVITHEAGHAYANYVSRDRVPVSAQHPGLEACEVHSMSMEFFAWPWAEGFFGKDTQKFYYAHLSGALTFIPYGTMVDHFQHIICEKPELTPGERHGVWRELIGIYMPWVKLGEIPFYGEGRGWQRQMHIYQSPFYYIDYCLAQSVALQFWAEIMRDSGAAWEKYMRYTAPGGTMTFTELVKTAGMLTPFEPGALEKVCMAADKWLEDFDETLLV